MAMVRNINFGRRPVGIGNPLPVPPIPLGGPMNPIAMNEAMALQGQSAISPSDIQAIGNRVVTETAKANNASRQFSPVANTGPAVVNSATNNTLLGGPGPTFGPQPGNGPGGPITLDPTLDPTLAATDQFSPAVDPFGGIGNLSGLPTPDIVDEISLGGGVGTGGNGITPVNPNLGGGITGLPPWLRKGYDAPPPPPPPPPPDPDPNDYVPSRSKIFSRFDRNKDVIKNVTEINTKGLWQNDSGSLSTFFTESTTSTQKEYYYGVYNGDPTDCRYGKQFDVTWGHYYGSGSLSIGGQVNDTPSRAIYSQLKLACLENATAETKFSFGDGNTDHVYAVLFNQAKMKDRVDPGNWQLWLSGSTGQVISLIDDSGDSDESLATETAHLTTRVYNVVSGSISGGVQNTKSYGAFYPDQGIIVIDGAYLDASASFNTGVDSNTNNNNAYKLFTAISGSTVESATRTFDARNSDVVTNEYYFVRVKSNEYNYSNNPTFVSGTLGEFRYQNWERNPKTYITTVGLYNDKRELLAVAKASQPILNTFEEEHLIRVKLEY